MHDRYGERGEKPKPFAFLFPDDATTGAEQTASRAAESVLRGYAIANCDLCDDDGYHGTTVCDHEDHSGAAKRGMGLIRETLGWPQP